MPTGTAFFGASNTTSLSFEDDATVGGWTFNAGASGYTFNNSHHLLFDGAGIVINGGSATILNNSGGITTFDNSSTAGNATITTNSGGSVFFAGTSSGGQAIFTTNAGGVFDMSQLTSGGTTAGSIAGGGTYFLGANALTVGSNNLSTAVGGVISDGGIGGGTGGALVKAGTGALTLSGTNSYTGATTVNAGTLEVDGSIAASSLLTVNNSGTLTGTGTVGNTQLNSGGVFTPGVAGMPGTSMTVSGNLAFQSGAIYQVYLNPSTSTSASVTGTASLAGTVNAFVGAGSLVNKQYTILQSAGLGGTTFSGVNTTVMLSPTTVHFFSTVCDCTVNASGLLLPALTGTLSYTPNDVLLSLTANLGAGNGVNPGLNANQQSVTAAINNYFNQGGVLPPQFVPLFGLSGAAFDVRVSQLTGEASTSDGVCGLPGTDRVPLPDARFGGATLPHRQRGNIRLRTGATGEFPARYRAGVCFLAQGAAASDIRSALERVGLGVRRQQYDQRRPRCRYHRGHGARHRLCRRHGLSSHPRRGIGLCPRRRRHQLEPRFRSRRRQER